MAYKIGENSLSFAEIVLICRIEGGRNQGRMFSRKVGRKVESCSHNKTGDLAAAIAMRRLQ